MRYDDHMWGNSWGWGEWILMTSLMVVFWAAVIAAIVSAVRYLAGSRRNSDGQPDQPPSSPPQSRAEEVLGERFARGEIEEDEYRSRMSTLREHR
ncbi:SHOCT domain-containing protein [Gordonia sp. HNM0687]|uniref:SHOCT domain-containing protein n=1 Tax=Gordonia mangrovi TaxID=2665643 RepID=A0A6L7GRI3_9ACTN|nr:SHOCT domain-containing protein [Gordonia mangrovi]MXP21305.1 SHOCT domain-containing protein [Gordonia mangrovi]UVF80055.1 SHOCT domain-containing protein [Gordonia mangrovi]